MVAEDKHWLYFLVDELGNSYTTTNTIAPTYVQIPNSGTKYISATLDQNWGSFREIYLKIGPEVVVGEVYNISIQGVAISYTALLGDTATIVRDHLYSSLLSVMLPGGMVLNVLMIATDTVFIYTSPAATNILFFIGGFINVNTILTVPGQVPLEFTPDGWQDISIAWERNLIKFGNVRNFSIPLKFVLDGSAILRNIIYTTNFEKKVFLLIKKLKLSTTSSTYNYHYDDYYRGEIDLSTINDEESVVILNIMEGGLAKDLKANEGTTYEIACDQIAIKMDGLDLKGTAKWLNIEEEMYNPLANRALTWPFMTFINSEGINFDGEFYSTAPNTRKPNVSSDIDDNYFPDDYFFKLSETAVGSTVVNINGNFPIFLLAGTLTIYVKNSNGTRITIATVSGSSINTTLSFNSNITVSPGEKLYLIVRGNNSGGVRYIIREGIINVSYSSKYKATNIFGVKPFVVFQKLIEKICGDTIYAESQILQDYEHLVVTCGDAIRGLANSKIKTTLNEFVESFNAILNIGIGVIDGRVVIEGKDFFAVNSSPIVLGNTRDMKTAIPKDLIFNTIKVGYPDRTYDDVNGRYEFNTTNIFTTDVKRIVAQLDLTSKYRADAYGIEYTRINLDGKITTDSSTDNDVFVINANLTTPNVDGSYPLRRLSYDSILGIPYPASIFNIEDLTPSRMMKRHLGYLNSCLTGFENTKIQFQSSAKNRELKTILSGTTFDEDADVILDGSNRIFKSFTFEFEVQVPTDLVETLQSNPNRCFSFVHPNGETFKGFNLKVGIKPDTDEKQAFILLSTPDNDLTKLI